MRAMIVSVSFSDMLALTLSRNHRLFDRICVVTTPADVDSVIVAVKQAGATDKVVPFATDLFTADGAAFNKWRALEAAWDAFGREGWCCHLDVDVIWPWYVEVTESSEDGALIISSGPTGSDVHTMFVKRGQLFSPLRRMLHIIDRGIPPEDDWVMLPSHRNLAEWAGYSQVFHASDPVLGPPPWHDVGYVHAGAADSWFQQKWAPENKVRPPWQVLHIGCAGKNWFGRTTPHLDGTPIPDAQEKLTRTAKMWENRRQARAEGRDPFADEKIKR